MKFKLRRYIGRLYDSYSEGQASLREAVILNNIRLNRRNKGLFYLSAKAFILSIVYLFRTPIVWVAILLPLLNKVQMTRANTAVDSFFVTFGYAVTSVFLATAISVLFVFLLVALHPAIIKSWKFSMAAGLAIGAPVVIFIEEVLTKWFGVTSQNIELPQTLIQLLITIITVSAIYWLDGYWLDPESSFYKKKSAEERKFEKFANELLYVQAQDQYVLLAYENEQTLLRKSFSNVLKDLKFEKGLRVHRSYWVSKDAIASIEKDGHKTTLILKDGSRIPVSKTYRDKLLALSN